MNLKKQTNKQTKNSKTLLTCTTTLDSLWTVARIAVTFLVAETKHIRIRKGYNYFVEEMSAKTTFLR